MRAHQSGCIKDRQENEGESGFLLFHFAVCQVEHMSYLCEGNAGDAIERKRLMILFHPSICTGEKLMQQTRKLTRQPEGGEKGYFK